MRSPSRGWGFGTVTLVTVLSAALVGCSPPVVEVAQPPEKCDLQVVTTAVISSEHINPSDAGEPRPVQIRLYQLKSDTKLQNSSFEDVWKEDSKALEDDLVKVEEFPVYPNTRTEVKFERDDAAQFVVAAGLFRNPKGKKWFKSFELPPAPSEGACGAECKEGECEEPELNPKLYVWVDGTNVDDGIEYADRYPEGRVVAAEMTPPAGGGGE